MEKQISFVPAKRTHLSHENSPQDTSPKTKNPKLDATYWKLYIDGAARGNPGPAGAGVYLTTQTDVVLKKEGFFLNKRTNNQAEYLALALGVFFIQKLLKEADSLPDLIYVYSDSELLINQMNGKYKVRNPELAELKKYIDAHLTEVPFHFKHIRREFNAIADSLANMGIDKKKKLPISFVNEIKTGAVV